MEYDINEWITPTDVELCRHTKGTGFDETNTYTESQTDQFAQFLFRASRYKSVLIKQNKRIVLVEDFPNIFFKDPDIFNEALEYDCNIFLILIL